MTTKGENPRKGEINSVFSELSAEDLRLQVMNQQILSELAGNVAHDLSNALLGATMISEVLRESLDEETSGYEHVSQVVREIQGAASLARNVHDYVRHMRRDLDELLLNDLVEHLLGDLSETMDGNVRVEFRPSEDSLSIKATGSWIEAIVKNLCSNAREAMPEGGTIIVETRRQSIGGTYAASNEWAQPGDFVLLTVTDSGVGMDEGTKRQITEPFFTTKKDRAGSGLGLTATIGIVKQLGGMFHVVSEPGEGTTVAVYLPVVEAV